MTDAPRALQDRLATFGQDHLLAFWDELSPPQQESLRKQCEALDLPRISEWIQQYVLSPQNAVVPSDIEPVDAIPPDGGEQGPEARTRGEELLAGGKVAAFVVAGGQGTRLGYEGPKGCLPATPVVHKPLFRLFAETIRATGLRYGVTIPWYILTSPTNDTASKAHFRQNDFWGLEEADVFFVMQGTLPAIGMDGKLLLARKDQLARSPDGHGGSLTALRQSGALEDMARRGIEIISYFQVDNPLVRIIDPLFLGLHEINQAEMSAKSLPKRSPEEKLGNFCRIDGQIHVIEYSDMPKDLARKCNNDGRLRFSAGSIAIHLLNRSFVERLTSQEGSLPLHRAEKKVPFVNADGEIVEPDTPNAIKLEKFVFDALPQAQNAMILETRRSQEFSPIKNAEGPDSLTTSLHDQVRRWGGWLEQAGIAVPRDADGQVAAAIEISPLFADSPEVLEQNVDQSISISPGQNFYLGSRGQIGGS